MNGITQILTAFALVLCLSTPAISQVTENEARQLMAEKEIPEDSLRARLILKGYDPDNIDPLQFADFQQVVTETIAEYEVERSLREAEMTEAVKDSAEVLKTPVAQSKAEENYPLPDNAKKKLSLIYGHSLFWEDAIPVFQNSDEIKPPETYILGVGDKIGISIFGASIEDKSYEIDRSGYIRPTQMPRILLKGISYGQAKVLLRQRFRQYYRFQPDEFEASVTYARKITVSILGEAKKKGSVTLPATNTALNALAAAGGPTQIGSVRKIRILSGSSERTMDIYKYLNDPRTVENLYLNENDVIFIPDAEKIITIEGAVLRPLKYELLDQENLRTAIELAGGLTPEAYQKDISITRYSNDQKVVANVDLRALLASGSDYELQNGDVINIDSIGEPVRNYVEVKGAVLKPGEYERGIGTRVSQILSQSGLKETARKDFAYILRKKLDGSFSFERFNVNEAVNNPLSPSDPLLQDLDQIVIEELSKFADNFSFSVSGAVRAPGDFQFNPGSSVKVEDAILLSGGLLPNATDFAYIIRKDPTEPKTVMYLYINVRAALSDPGSSENMILEPNDNLRISDKNSFREDFFIRINGAVGNPGEYEFDRNMSITNALQLAGGLKFSAATNKIDIARVIFKENEPTRIAEYTIEVDRDLRIVSADSAGFRLMPFDNIYVREVPDFELQQMVTISGEVKYPGEYALLGANEKLASLVERSGGLSEEAYTEGAELIRTQRDLGPVVIQLNKALESKNSAWNLILQRGDRLTIPKREDLVTIEGAINLNDLYKEEFLSNGNRISVGFERGKNALYYINEYAAGISENGKSSLVTVEQRNGKIEKTRTFLFFKSYPKVQEGATIRVGRKPAEVGGEKAEKEEVDWNGVIRDVVAQATAVLTLILLLDRTTN